MKIAYIVSMAGACAQLSLSARQPKPGEAPPALGVESLLQAPSDAQPSWGARKGKVVVLEFWATWCGPCVAAIPHLNQLADKLKDEPIQFIGITTDEEKVVRPFLRKKPIHAWIGLGTDRSMFDAYDVTAIPRTVIVDATGIIAAIIHPTDLTEGLLRDVLAGKRIASAQLAKSTPEREALFQMVIRPSKTEGTSSSVSNKGSLAFSRATVLDVLSSSYGINPVRIVNSSALPEGRFDFNIKTPERGKDNAQSWLRQAVAATFGVTARLETRETEAFILKAGQPTGHLAATASVGSSGMSSGGGSLNCMNQSMSSLAWSLEEMLKKPVINETSLTNYYDFQLLWNEKASGEADAKDLASALHEQLGLELEPARREIEVLVVTVADRSADLSANEGTN